LFQYLLNILKTHVHFFLPPALPPVHAQLRLICFSCLPSFIWQPWWLKSKGQFGVNFIVCHKRFRRRRRLFPTSTPSLSATYVAGRNCLGEKGARIEGIKTNTVETMWETRFVNIYEHFAILFLGNITRNNLSHLQKKSGWVTSYFWQCSFLCEGNWGEI
jgi:hypothetical protein